MNRANAQGGRNGILKTRITRSVFTASCRRDQRAVCCASRAGRRPVSPSPPPVPLRKPRARHKRASAKCRMSGGLPSVARRRALRSALRFARRSSPLSAPRPRSPTADRSLNWIFRAPFGAVRLAVPTILVCARLPQPTRILLAVP